VRTDRTRLTFIVTYAELRLLACKLAAQSSRWSVSGHFRCFVVGSVRPAFSFSMRFSNSFNICAAASRFEENRTRFRVPFAKRTSAAHFFPGFR